jgi:hypothetical protein
MFRYVTGGEIAVVKMFKINFEICINISNEMQLYFGLICYTT